MIVSELITKLLDMPADAEVLVSEDELPAVEVWLKPALRIPLLKVGDILGNDPITAGPAETIQIVVID